MFRWLLFCFNTISLVFISLRYEFWIREHQARVVTVCVQCSTVIIVQYLTLLDMITASTSNAFVGVGLLCIAHDIYTGDYQGASVNRAITMHTTATLISYYHKVDTKDRVFLGISVLLLLCNIIAQAHVIAGWWTPLHKSAPRNLM
jgi:hypothetical protein